MEVKEIKDKNTWENFLLGCEEKTFLDSWNWGEFQRNMGNKIWRFGVFEGAKLLSVALAFQIQARRGTFLFVPHGPASATTSAGNPNIKYEILKTLLEELKNLAKKENCSFIRISPIWERDEENTKVFKDLGFRDAPIHIHPEVTWESDITPLEEDLLMNMRKTTRYLIKQAQKNKDVKVYQSPAFAEASAGRQDLKDIEIFNKLYQEVAGRHHFIPFPLDYLKNEFSAFNPDHQPIQQVQGCPERAEGQISIFFGKYKNEIISSGIFIFWQNIAFYHHGASLLKYPKIPVSYLLQWEAIREAKKRACKVFNFWGIAPPSSTGGGHPWAGLTLFKMGFGGYKKEYVKTQDLLLSKKYWLTYLFEKLRKTKRGL